MADIYQILKQLHISYKKYNHPPVFTVDEASKIDRDINAGKTKNLLLKNKDSSKFYLIIIAAQKRLDIKQLGINLTETKLSFAYPDELMHHLQLTPGSVSPFGLINDKNHVVNVVIDKTLLNKDALGFHPNINTATLVINRSDLIKFLDWTKNKVIYLAL